MIGLKLFMIHSTPLLNESTNTPLKTFILLDFPDYCRDPCLILSGVVVFYGTTTVAGAYIWLFLAGIGLILLGAERLISGLTAKGVKKTSRLINIGVGLGLIIYIGSGFFFPDFATKWLIIFLGFGLLANGVIRIVKSSKEEKRRAL